MRKLIGAAVLVLSTVAAADDRPERAGAAMGVIAVAEPPTGPSEELTALSDALRAAVAQQTAGVLSQQDVRQRMLTRSPAASLSELDRAYAGAVAAHQGGDYEGAVRSLTAVITDLEKMPDGADAFGQWKRAVMRLARAQQSLGRKGDAEETMRRLLRAEASIKADPELYPPSFQRQLDEIRKELAAQPKHKLTVKGPKGTRVYIEGREVGDAPVTVSLPPGKYRVSGAQRDLRVTAGSYDLSNEDQVAVLDFTLVEMFRPDAGPGLAAPLANRAKAIVTAGAALQLDQVLATTIAIDGDVRFLVGTIYDVRRGMIVREGRLRLQGQTVPEGGLRALAGFLISGQSSNLVISGAEAKSINAPPAAVKVSARPAGKGGGEVLGWSAIGTGAVTLGLAGVATWQGLSAQGRYGEAFELRDPATGGLRTGVTAEQYDGLVTRGNDARNLALITGGGAVAALAATSVLSYLAYQQSGAIGPFRF